MKKYNKEKEQYEYVSRYQLLTKLMTEFGYEATLVAFNSENDMYRCKIIINDKESITAWFTDDEVKEMYSRKRQREKEKKDNHKRYVKRKNYYRWKKRRHA